VDTHKKIVYRAASLGAKYLTHHPGQIEGLSTIQLLTLESSIERYGGKEEFEKRNYEVMEVILKECEKYNITPTVENLPPPFGGNFAATPERLVYIVEKFKGKFGICFDSGHAHGFGFNPDDVVLKFGKYLKETHLNDNLGKRYEKENLSEYLKNDLHFPVGIGTINWIE